MKRLEYPFSEKSIRALKAGDAVSITGRIYTGRDKFHKFFADGGKLPVDFEDGALYHCGPVVVSEDVRRKTGDAWRVVAAGPTTSVRENPYEPDFIAKTGVRIIIGKGGMDGRTLAAMRKHGCVYVQAVGGGGAIYADAVKTVAGVSMLREFGAAEAVWHLDVADFRGVVAMDAHGNSLFETVRRKSADVLKRTLTAFAAALLVAVSAVAAETGVILDAHPDWMALHAKAVELARRNMEDVGPDWKPQMTCMPGVGIIWQWDSCFMALFAGYTPGDCNGLGNLDNLYKMQAKDGCIEMAYRYSTGQPAWPGRINPPLYAWCEWLYARRTGDTSRLARAYGACSRLYGWIKANRTRKANGLYWFEDAGSSGMDNSPRAGYFATHLDGCDACFVDLCCQQVLSARCLAKIAPLVGKAEEAAGWTAEADRLAEKINRLMWSEKTRFYHDVYIENNNKLSVKTAAAFWALVSGVATSRQAECLADQLRTGPFAVKSGVASLSNDDPNYNPEGGYWLGGVWPPIQYMVCRGLRAHGYRELAREIAKKHLDCMAAVLKEDKEHTIWECYSPESDRQATDKFGLPVRKDFVGWGGLGPLVMLVEDIIGLDIAALENRVVWHLSEPGRQGVKEVPFNGGTISLEANAMSDGAFTVKVGGNRPFHLTVISKNGRGILEKDITPGRHEFLPKGDEL